MTQLGVGNFAQQQAFSAPNEPQKLNEKERQKSEESQKTSTMAAALGDILLNTFQIKKKRYRVLLNYDHIVWEAYNRKQQEKEQKKQQQVEQQRHLEAGNEKQGSKKDSEPESEQLAQSSSSAGSYGSNSHIVHIDEIIRVAKGPTKAAVTRLSSSQNNNASPAAAPENTSVPTDQYLCLHYVERVVKSSTDCNRWHVRQLILYNSDPYIVRQWHTALSKMLHNASRLRVQRLLVFINPYGGRQQGLQVYERHCKPLFQLANIDASCIISQRANQIRDILMSHDLKQYDAVCCVGGDGTAAEVINGLIFRAMQDLGLDMLQPEFIPKPCLPIGIIPAGSTDTIAYSVHGTSDVRTAAIHLILGQRRGLDVCSVRNREGLVRFCASVLSYGYLGDVAAKSEKYRWMGTKRYEYTGVKAFLSNRGYEAELRLLEAPLADEEPQPSTSSSTLNQQSSGGNPLDSKCYVNCQRCSTANSLQSMMRESTSSWLSKSAEALGSIDPDSDLKTSENVKTFQSNQDCDSEVNKVEVEEEEEKAPSSVVADEENSDSEQWKVIKGRFFMISGANITCACSRSPNGISRFSHLGDGYLDLILVRKTSILNNLKFLLNTVGRNGDIRNLPFVEVYRTRKFTFRTLGGSSVDCGDRGSCQPIAELSEDTEYSSWNCDGEVVCDLEITMSSHCQLIDVFMRGPYPHSKLTAGKLAEQSSLMNCCCAK